MQRSSRNMDLGSGCQPAHMTAMLNRFSVSIAIQGPFRSGSAEKQSSASFKGVIQNKTPELSSFRILLPHCLCSLVPSTTRVEEGGRKGGQEKRTKEDTGAMLQLLPIEVAYET